VGNLTIHVTVSQLIKNELVPWSWLWVEKNRALTFILCRVHICDTAWKATHTASWQFVTMA